MNEWLRSSSRTDREKGAAVAKRDVHVGDRIRRLRQERDLSLNQLAERSSVSKSYLWSLENEEAAGRPGGETLYKIAEALGVTMSELLGRRLLTEPPEDVPKTLQAFATSEGLSDADVRMLASIRFRGQQPSTEKAWAFVYQAIRAATSPDAFPGARLKSRKPSR
jgi:transcriptional regulator with XRE-family HTH domain